MKPIIPFALLGALLAVGTAQAASTTPVGYVTYPLSPNKYNLVSLTTHNATVAAGVITGESANSVTVAGSNFTTLLQANAVYILELPNGVIQEISAWTADTLTTPNDITASVTPNTTTFKLRKAATVSDVFGANNSVGLKTDADEDYSNNDLVLIPNAVGAFDSVYYFNGEDAESRGWYDLNSERAENKIINYADGIFVQRGAGTGDIPLVVTGEVKTTPTAGVLTPGFNFLGAVAPAGLTLANSGLQTSLTIATSEETIASADLVLKQLPSGAYRSAYYYNDGEVSGWYDLESAEADSLVLDGGFLIQNKGAASKAYTVAVPTSYNTL